MRGGPLLTAGLASCGLALFVGTAAVARVSGPQARTHRPTQKPAAAERAVPFAVGESLEYDVSWSSYLTAGTATLSIRARKPSYDSVAYYVVAEGQATGFAAALYPAYYKADTLLDVYTLLPQRGSIYSQEARHQRLRETRFDQSRKTARFAVTPGGRQKSVTLPGPTHDALSVVLAMRMLSLKDGLSVTWPVCDSGRVMNVRVTVRGRERLSTRLGELMAWRIEPVIVGDTGELGARGLTLWLSDDERKLPLLMEAEMPVGRFVLRLRSAGQ
jgi:uncharacterized protein DUF3108